MTVIEHDKIIADIQNNGPYVSVKEGIKFLCSLKSHYGITWDDVALISHEVFNTSWKEGFFRKNYGEYAKAAAEIHTLDDKLLELKKERAKLSDERIQNNAYIRRLAREETIKEIALEAAKEVGKSKNLELSKFVRSCSDISSDKKPGKEAILCISDWHAGLEIDSALNTYNMDVLQRRLQKLQDKVISRLQRGDLSKLRVVNLGDMIAGRIHLQLRLGSRIDVITQIMTVSEMVAELLANLAHYISIEYYSCLDNHSRVEPNKKDSLDLESLCRITDWYLAERLKNISNIHINKNDQGEDIITFKSLGHDVVGVHGDKDKKTQLEHLQLMLGYSCDLLLISHLHHPWMEESNNTKIIGNGALMGTDDYARGLRLNSRASQNLIVVSEENVCEELYIIDLQ